MSYTVWHQKKRLYIDHSGLYIEPKVGNWFSYMLGTTAMKDFIIWCHALKFFKNIWGQHPKKVHRTGLKNDFFNLPIKQASTKPPFHHNHKRFFSLVPWWNVVSQSYIYCFVMYCMTLKTHLLVAGVSCVLHFSNSYRIYGLPTGSTKPWFVVLVLLYVRKAILPRIWQLW